jgi:hypothetical protein
MRNVALTSPQRISTRGSLSRERRDDGEDEKSAVLFLSYWLRPRQFAVAEAKNVSAPIFIEELRETCNDASLWAIVLAAYGWRSSRRGMIG